MFIEFSSLICPAEQYVFSIWGHGTGFRPVTDVPGKYEVGARQATRGVIGDEWNDKEQLNMYELDNAFKAAFIHYRDINWSQQHLDHYTLSVCLVHQLYYTYDYKDILPNPLCRFDEGYEYCDISSLLQGRTKKNMPKPRAVCRLFTTFVAETIHNRYNL